VELPNLIVQGAQADSQDIGSFPPIVRDPGKNVADNGFFHILERLIQWNADLWAVVLLMAYRNGQVPRFECFIGRQKHHTFKTLRSSRTFPGQAY